MTDDEMRKVSIEQCDKALADPKFTHARARKFWHCFNDWVVVIYHRDTDSPTGVISAAGGRLKDIEHLFKKHNRPFPISPTEPR